MASVVGGLLVVPKKSISQQTKHTLSHSQHVANVNPNPNPTRRSVSRRMSSGLTTVRAEAETMATEKLGVKIHRNPPESLLSQLGVTNWPKWGCPPSKFPWTYSSKETCYLLKGKVKVQPEGSNEFVEIGAGDLVEFPKGMSCTWDVSVAVDKHYMFE